MPFEGDAHTGENIADNLFIALSDWEITDKVKLIITDNASNMITAMKNLPQIYHLSCMASCMLHSSMNMIAPEQAAEALSVSTELAGKNVE